MAGTKIADVIQPELFTQYVIDETTEKSELVTSGIITSNPELNQLVTGGGTTINMPMWNDLGGESQVLNDQDPITVDKITSKAEIATMLIRARAWGAHELAGALAGADPMQAIVSLVAKWWVRDEKKILMSILKGIFSATTMAELIHAATGKIDANTVLDAKQRLGDAADQLTALYMHSATFTELQKQNVITFIPASRSEILVPTYLGYRVIYDDSAPVETVDSKTVYTTYLMASGVIARGVGTPVSLTPTETDRDSLGSTDYLINRQAKVLHPTGISWKGAGAITNPTPSNAELSTGTNWERVREVKKIGIVKLTHTLV